MQQALKPASGAARAQVVAAELLGELDVAVDETPAALDAGLGGIGLPPLRRDVESRGGRRNRDACAWHASILKRGRDGRAGCGIIERADRANPQRNAPAFAALTAMPRVVGIDHLVLSVGDLARSRDFYAKVLGFLGFKLKHDGGGFAGWSNGKTLFWIAQADAQGRKRRHRKGDIGFHHYAFELASRKAVDDLGAFLERTAST